ncbi:acyltransferase-like protein At1g54570, chloroplastic isoform X2 [Olea europaea var. sylvestris]|uniref:Acyltransferase At1g54570, chloroplastic isoform X1 n=3 Tax=Olea europaea subsp. europaea TaxID=158383 RepID=A0A8S0SUM4_OLEEU|nr:acyltransferase-like protein At1g54570, chloroplastic isoform X2 [Olea europaea var. sylvestris]CAA2996387.1 acyltransferase At1g54570, chloroplastic isoform X1 [Olea europaea subsp. europaea]
MASMGKLFAPLVLLNPKHKPCYPVWVASRNTISVINNCFKKKKIVQEKLEPLWDDGYGTQTAKDFLEAAKDMIMPDNGPPRWLCPIECGSPIKNSPVLLFLPGIDGLGMGLIVHHKALGKVFEVQCMHIPIDDRTPFEGLVKFVSEKVRSEHALFPNRPIYLVGESFGGCLALSVAAFNPTIDLVVILANPATSFSRSQLQPMFPFMEACPKELHKFLPHIFGLSLGNPIKMANVNVHSPFSPAKKLENLFHDVKVLVEGATLLADLLPKETLSWKFKLLKSGAAHANSHLHAVKSEVLVLASCMDCMLPSAAEAGRLLDSLENCKVRYFYDNGHALLVEDGINLLSVIKGTSKYRRSKTHDFVSDFIPPSKSEFKGLSTELLGIFRLATSPAMFSTLETGKIVRGLSGIPDQGPVLLVGNHMFFGAEIGGLVEEYLREKKIVLHGAAHPEIFAENIEAPLQVISGFDMFRVFGAVPVTARNFYKLLLNKCHVVLYPGGVREALHRKGEKYKLFWPEEPEFVRMALKFGAKIVPFGVVGEDDIQEQFLDYNDVINIPIIKEMIKTRNNVTAKVMTRTHMTGEVGNQDFFIPGIYPKIPGRFYFLLGKPIETKGREELLKNREACKELYLQIQSEITRNMEYLLKKREEDPYRHLFERTIYRALLAPVDQIPAFDP